MRRLLRPLTVVPALAALLYLAMPPRAAGAPPERTVYVTVADSKGAPVSDLTAADFTVKEAGKEREVAKAEVAKARMRVALLVEERLLGDSAVRMGLFEFVKRMQESADTALISAGMRNTTIVDYTNSLDAFVQGINALTLNQVPSSYVAEGILAVVKGFTAAPVERPVLVVLAISSGESGVAPNTIVAQIRQSGVAMHAIALGGATSARPSLSGLSEDSARDQILGEGPKQAGGRRHDVLATAAVQRALQVVADDLLSQYAISYTLPDDAKTDRRISVAVKRRGLTVRAPSAIPEK